MKTLIKILSKKAAKPISIPALAFVACCVLASQSRAEVSCTPPGGYVKMQIAGRSENVIAAPMRKRGVFTGRIVETGSNTLSFSAPGWTSDQFAQSSAGRPRFYLELVSGDLTGLYFPISSNTGDTVVLDTGEGNLSAPFATLGTLKKNSYVTVTGTDGTEVQTLQTVGDMARIRPAWTIGEVFGGSNAVLMPFATMDAANPANGGGDRVDLPANGAPGLLARPGKALHYITSLGWRSAADAATEEGDNALLPGTAVIVHRSAADEAALLLIGYPKTDRSVLGLPGNTGGQSALTYLASPFSEPLSLDEAGLATTTGSTGGVRSSPSLNERGDELFLFEGSHGGPVPVPMRRFVSLTVGDGQEWRELGNTVTTGAAPTIQPGRGFAILKRSNANGGYWISLPGYIPSAN